MQDILQHLEHQVKFHTTRIEGNNKAARDDKYLVLVTWMGLGDEEAIWKPISRVLEDDPTILTELRPLRLPLVEQEEIQETMQVFSVSKNGSCVELEALHVTRGKFGRSD